MAGVVGFKELHRSFSHGSVEAGDQASVGKHYEIFWQCLWIGLHTGTQVLIGTEICFEKDRY